MKKKIIIPIVAVVLVVVIAILGVNIYNGRIPFNYKLDVNSRAYLQAYYLEENTVRGAYYQNPDYTGGEGQYQFYQDKTSPKTITTIITDEESFNQIFKENYLDISFDKEMVILHVFASSDPANEYKITKMTLDKEDVLRIDYKLKLTDKKGGAMPGAICFLVKMKKTDVKAVEFVEQR
ncbi:MAG: hypothetical protein E7350_00110 [Clostridiales bacterium]|nr:hypothetical protein [Clostridiales bacterium]